MKKIGIITINDINNYGNRLQNYALQEYIKKIGFEVETIRNEKYFNHKGNFKYRCYLFLKYLKEKLKILIKISPKRKKSFKAFNKNINFSKKTVTAYSKNVDTEYDYFIVGSDQVWKPKYLRMSDVDMLSFATSEQKISYAASFGVNNIKEEELKKLKKGIKDFKSISVREDSGKDIVFKATGREDIEVLIDPTMLLTSKEWDKVSKKPSWHKDRKYILTYFLGKLSEERKKEIEKIANENNYDIINILDSKTPYYNCGPSEFLYLEKNAQLICTDSFHSSVFAIIYNRPFIIYDREEKGMSDMNSRTDTLITKFKLRDRNYNNKYITNSNLNHDYALAYKILEEEKAKSFKFLTTALNIKESDINE